MGRKPLPINEDLIEKIYQLYESSDLGIEQTLREFPEAPSLPTFYVWIESSEEFLKRSARARERKAGYFADRAVQESFTARIGQISKVGPKGEEITVADNVARSQLIVQTLLKRAGQLNPKEYADTKIQKHEGSDGGPIQFALRHIKEGE